MRLVQVDPVEPRAATLLCAPARFAPGTPVRL